jgi:hypothetical protein
MAVGVLSGVDYDGWCVVGSRLWRLVCCRFGVLSGRWCVIAREGRAQLERRQEAKALSDGEHGAARRVAWSEGAVGWSTAADGAQGRRYPGGRTAAVTAGVTWTEA